MVSCNFVEYNFKMSDSICFVVIAISNNGVLNAF